MRNFRNSLIAVLVIAGVAALASGTEYGIEVLGIEVLSGGELKVDTHSVAPPGAYVDAVMPINGQEVIVDTQPVDPATGLATVYFPGYMPGSYVALKLAGSKIGWQEIIESD